MALIPLEDTTSNLIPLDEAPKGALSQDGLIPLDNLIPLETRGIADVVKELPERTIRATGAFMPEMASGLWGLGRAGAELASDFVGKPLAAATGVEASPLESAAEFFKGQQTSMKDLAKFNRGDQSELGTVEKAAYSGLESLGGNLLTAPLTAARTSAGLTAMVAPVVGGEYGEAREKNLNPAQSILHAGVQGVAEWIPEKFAVGDFFKELEKGSGIAKQVKGFILRDMVGEQATTAWQDFNNWATLHPEKTIQDYFAERPGRMLETAVSTVVAGGGAAAIFGGIEASERRADKKRLKSLEAEIQAEIDILTKDAEARAGMTRPPEMTPKAPPETLTQEQINKGKMQLANLELSNQENVVDPAAAEFGAALDERFAKFGVQLNAPDVGGITDSVASRRLRDYEGPVTSNMLQHLWASDERVIGLRGDQYVPTPGQVTIIGVPGDKSHNPEYLDRLGQTVKRLVDKYAPDMAVTLNAQMLDPTAHPDAFALHTAIFIPSQSRFVHTITPREMPSLKYQGGNQQTQVEMLTSLMHEFGHALKLHTFLQGMDGQLASTLRNELAGGLVTPETMQALAAVDPARAKVIQEWATLRAKVLDGTMTAKEFMDQWVGVRKHVPGMMKGTAAAQGRYQWLQERLQAHAPGKNVETATALDVVNTFEGKANYVLNFDEYMAEQFSRYAYAKGDVAASSLGQWFANALEKLRNLFATLKKEGAVAPQVGFQEWLEQQTIKAEGMKKSKKATLSPEVQKARKALLQAQKESEETAPEGVGEPVVVAPPPPVVQAANPRDAVDIMTANLDGMVGAFNLPDDNGLVRAARKALDNGDLERARTFMNKLQEKYGDIHFDKDGPGTINLSKMLQRLPNKEQLKRETLTSLQKQADLREADRKIIEQVLMRYPEGNVPRSALEELVTAAVVPLKVRWSNQYARMGLAEFGKSSKEVFDSAATLVYDLKEDEFTLPGSKHFPSDLAYLAHSRHFVEGGIPHATEIQSDYFQRVRFPETGRKPAGDFSETLSAEAAADETDWIPEALADLNSDLPELLELVQELQVTPQEQWAVSDVELAQRYMRSIERNVVKFGGDAAQLAPIWQGFMGTPQENLQAQQALQALVMQAEKLGFQLQNTAAKETMQELGRAEFSKRWYERILQEWSNEMYRKGANTVRLATAETLVKLQMWGEAATEVEQQAVAARHKQFTEAFARKFYGAREVQDAAGNTWLEWNAAVKGKEILHWDRDNPTTPNVPGAQTVEVAGLTDEQFRDPTIVAQAAKMWQEQKTDSPFFQRWWKEKGATPVITGMDGKPLKVLRGTATAERFLDATTRGGHTKATSAKLAFWFTTAPEGAQYYADSAKWSLPAPDVSREREIPFQKEVKTPAAKILRKTLPAGLEREAQALRRGLNKAKELNKPELVQRFEQKLKDLHDAHASEKNTKGVVQAYYLRLTNPMIVEEYIDAYSSGRWSALVQEALDKGHDGIWFKKASDPVEGQYFAVFSEFDVKADANIGTFDRTDTLHWDKDNPDHQNMAAMLKGKAGRFWASTIGWAGVAAMNRFAWIQDGLVQMQQRAGNQLPNGKFDLALQQFLRTTQQYETFKNLMQYPGEQVVKKLLHDTSRDDRALLQGALEQEWKEGGHYSQLVGVDGDGQVVYVKEKNGNSSGNRLAVVRWEHRDSSTLRAYLAQKGIDASTDRGLQLLQLYLEYKNAMLLQLTMLERTLQDQAESRFGEAPDALNLKLMEIEQVMHKLRHTPWVPQGRFGNHVLVMKKRMLNAKGRMVWTTVYAEHFESKAERDVALKKALQNRKSDEDVFPRELDEYSGIPLQLPQDFIQELADTGLYDQEQLEKAQELMVALKHKKLESRYAKLMDKVIGGASKDFIANYAGFIWHNANFVTKTRFREDMNTAIAAARRQVRKAERSTNPVDNWDTARQLRRNMDMMRETKDYMLRPPYEFQQAKMYVTLLYLAYNIKTAVMNLGTQLNTAAALTSEYGELKGLNYWRLGMQEAAGIHFINQRLAKATDQETQRELNELKVLYDRAQMDGVVDQSYAYYLAGQAMSSTMTKALKRTVVGEAAHQLAEYGMFPFRAMELANRWSTLIAVYKAEMDKGRGVKPYDQLLREAYETAVAKVNLLQNSYDAANRPAFFRGQKGLFTMFMSYTQFQGWILTGGYERAARAQAKAQGQEYAGVWHGPTMKLWVLYLALAGLSGMPFGEDAMQLAQWIWRKLGEKGIVGKGENLEHEARMLAKSIGVDPNLAMHGLLHDVGGFDLSGSFGFGRVVPGMELLNKEFKSGEEALGKGVLTMSGVAGNAYQELLSAIAGGMKVVKGEQRPEQALRTMPGAIGAVAKAVDAQHMQKLKPGHGVMAGNSGVPMTRDLLTGELRDLTTWELTGMALGGNPTILSQNREMHYSEIGEKVYWTNRRQEIIDKYVRAKVIEQDAEMLTKVEAKRQVFNSIAPTTGLKVTAKDLAESVRNYRKKLRMGDHQREPNRDFRPLRKEIREGFIPLDEE